MPNTPAGPRGSSRVVRHGFLYVVGTALQHGLGLLLLPVVTRVLGVEEYGLAATATAIGALLALVYGLGINFSVVRFYYDDPADARRTRWAALLRTQLLVAAALALVTYATGPLWASVFEDFGWNGALQAAVVLGYAMAWQQTAQGVLRAARRPFAFIAATLVHVGVGGGLGIWLAHEHGAAGYVIGLTIGSALAGLGAFLATYRAPLWQRDTVAGGVRLGLPFMVHALSNWGLDLATRLMVAGYLGLAAVGRFHVAFAIGSALTLVLTGIQSAFAPFYVGELSPAERRATPPVLMLPVTAVAICATMLLVLFGPALLNVLVPGAFGGTELVLGLAAAGTIARAAYLVGAAVVLDQKRSGSLARGSGAGALVAVGLGILLIPAIGIEGAALATVVGIMVQAAVVLRDVSRRLAEPMHLPLLACLWLAAAGALAAVSQLPEDGLGLVARVGLGFAVAGAGISSIRWLRTSFADARNTALTLPEQQSPVVS